MTDQSQKQGYQRYKTFASNVLIVVTALSLILGLGIMAYNLVDSRIERIVNDEQFIRKVADHIRPYVIFDVNESILVDGGAMQALEQIRVEIGTEDGTLPVKIVVTPKYHLAHAPLIEKLGAGRFIYTPNPKRGAGHQWIYEFEVVHWKEDETPVCFRLEIIR